MSAAACPRCRAPLHGDVDHLGRVALTCRCGTVPILPRAPTLEERGRQVHRPLPARSVPRTARAQRADHPWKRRNPDSDAA